MRTFLWIVLACNQLGLLLIGAVKLNQFEMSEFAFKEALTHQSGHQAKLHRALHRLLPKVRLLQLTKITVLLITSAVLFSHLNQPVLGLVYTLLSCLVIIMLSRILFIQNQATRLFEYSLELLLKVTELLQPLWVLTGVPKRRELLQPHSLAEFTDQLRRLPSTVVSPVQRQRLETLLESDTKEVKDIMTPKKRVIMVEPSATLGPIVLSDLQKSGHGYFPVATKKGEPEGVLTLSDVSDLQLAKQRPLVRDFMSAHVVWVEEVSSLSGLTQSFLQEKQYLVFVRNQEGELSGVVTIADLMKHLVGIVKE